MGVGRRYHLLRGRSRRECVSRETRRYAPNTYGERSAEVRNTPSVSACWLSYRTLSRVGYYARYDERYALTEREARELLDVDFRAVEAVVMQALGQPAPVW